MKTRNIFAAAIAVLALAVSCQKEQLTVLDGIKVSSSYVAIPVGTAEEVAAEAIMTQKITVTAKADWEILDWKTYNKDDKTKVETGAWLTVSPMNGQAGETVVTFSSKATASNNAAEVKIKCGEEVQILNVIQGVAQVSKATCAQIMAGPDSKTYRVTGKVTKITETATYGNWYINDGTVDGDGVYIYGTKYEGKTKQAALEKLGIEVGDELTIEGPKTTYNGTVELVDVDVIKVVKSLCKVENSDSLKVEKEGGLIQAKVIAKGGELKFNIKADWLSVRSIESIAATYDEKGKEKTPAMLGVNILVGPNEGGAREGQIDFTSGSSTVAATISQAGAIVEVSVAEFLAAAEGTALFKVSGFITNRTDLSGHKFDLTNYGNFDLTDASGNVYVYGIGAKGDIATYGVKEGDIITVIGQRGAYNGAPQMAKGQYVSHKAVAAVTAAGVAALTDDDKNDPKNYIRLTGKVTKPAVTTNKFDLETYGNFDLVDESGAIYVYGVSTGWNGETKKFGTLGVKEGDTITIVGYKTSYKGAAQVVAMYVSHTSAE